MARPRRVAAPDKIRSVLRRTFGLKRLRAGQEAVIGRVLAGLPTLALMPTGGGKSLCYQLPAVLLEGRTVVISPLIALMKDQCDALEALGIAAVQLHSGLTASELADSLRAIADGSARIVFTTPERLLDSTFVGELKRHRVALLVVDEAHCISQWGFDFRPAFLEIGASVKALGQPPVLALTATATESVVDEIRGLLGIPRAGVVGIDAYRPNLHYRAEHFSRAEDKLARLTERVLESAGSGLVYTATVKSAEAVQQALVSAGEPAGLYHGRLGAAKRRAAQDAFMNGAVRVMVATNAFGLGIDKPDIRFVVHHQAPAGLDAYYQESGRAGRDGGMAECTLMFVEGDRAVQRFFLAGRYPQAHDFQAVVDALRGAAPDAAGWTLATLEQRLGHVRKVAVAVNVLRKQAWLHVDEEGRVSLCDSQAAGSSLAPLAQASAARAVHDREMLERMIAYAHSGRCRWQLLLEHLEGAPAETPCQACDNCLRLAAHEAQGTPGYAGSAAASAAPGKAFEVGERVRTRRHGPAEVVASDALSVTVRFDNGETRSFLPRFVAAARGRRREAQAAAPA